jgi:hypothetical protein
MRCEGAARYQHNSTAGVGGFLAGVRRQRSSYQAAAGETLQDVPVVCHGGAMALARRRRHGPGVGCSVLADTASVGHDRAFSFQHTAPSSARARHARHGHRGAPHDTLHRNRSLAARGLRPRS